MPDRPHPSKFRARFLAGETLLGTFIKTPTSHTSEVIGSLGFDFVVIDEEHSPFGRGTIDQALLGARAAGTATFCTACCISTPDRSSLSTRSGLCSRSNGVAVWRVSHPSSTVPIRTRAGTR